MAQTALWLLSLRRLFHLPSQTQRLYSHYSSRFTRSFSSIPSPPSPDPPKPSNLSARLSFVFDQIDAIERDRSQKDQALQRIRTWRDSKTAQDRQTNSTQSSEPVLHTNKSEIRRADLSSPDSGVSVKPNSPVTAKKAVELVHPWPEWIELMERLVHQNYFDHKRRDEGKMISDVGFDMGEDAVLEGESFDFIEDLKTVQTAGLNFGKDRFDIFRSLSRQDIQVMVGFGCPTTDKKVVFSAKLLRKHAHLDEGDVCSSCSLRSSCERAYLITNKEDEARTIDIMRVLMAFGFDHLHSTVTNKSLLKQKSVKNVVRKLLHEVVKLSAVPIDPNLPPPVIKRPPPKVKQPPPPPKKRVGRDDIEMKKGDWLCPKCDFMNFAKNLVCLQCDAKRPKRQLLPGEWECPECNFLNYRRNVVCFHCECKRPPDQFMEDRLQEARTDSRMRPEKALRKREEVSNAWNFDFDDDESDGADVAAFEYADSTVKSKEAPLESRDLREGPEIDFHRGTKFSKINDAEYSPYESKDQIRSGFDDFDDEDDVDSYEVDTANDHSTKSLRDFSEFEGDSDFEDGRSDSETLTDQSASSRTDNRRRRFSDSEDDETDFGSEKELSVHPNWRSSHVADSRNGNRGRGLRNQPRRLSYGSDEDFDIDSDDDFGSRKGKMNKFSGRRGSKQINFRSDDEITSWKPQSRGNRGVPERRNSFKGKDMRNLNRESSRSRFSDDFDDEPSRGSRGRRQGSRGGFSGRKMDHREGGSRNFPGRREESGERRRGNLSRYDEGKGFGGDTDDFRNRRRVIER